MKKSGDTGGKGRKITSGYVPPPPPKPQKPPTKSDNQLGKKTK
jgi:hypothetical protein